MKRYWQCLAFILFLWLFSVEGSFKSAKFMKRNVTNRTYLKSKIKAESLVGASIQINVMDSNFWAKIAPYTPTFSYTIQP